MALNRTTRGPSAQFSPLIYCFLMMGATSDTMYVLVKNLSRLISSDLSEVMTRNTFAGAASIIRGMPRSSRHTAVWTVVGSTAPMGLSLCECLTL